MARNGAVQAQDPEAHIQILCAGIYWNSSASGSLDKPGLNLMVSLNRLLES
jgi:hypothetical protein